MFGQMVNFWQIRLELEAVIRVSKINGRLLKRGSAVAFSVPGRLLLVRMCFAKEEFLVRRKKRRSSSTQGTKVSCLSRLTRSLSRLEKRGVAPSPFLPLLTTETASWPDVQSPPKRDTTNARLTTRSTLPPPSNKTRTLSSACFSSATTYSCKPRRLSLYTFLYCLYTRLLVCSGSMTPSFKSIHCLLLFLSRAISFVPRTETSLVLEQHPLSHQSILITPSNATSAIAFAGNALKKHGTKPLQ